MPDQAAVTVRAAVRPETAADLAAALVDVRQRGHRDGDLPLAELTGVHFARLFVLEESADLDGRPIPASLVYMADVDGTVDAHLGDLAARAGRGVDRLFGHCVGYPADPGPDQRRGWLADHALHPAAYYVHTVGRTVDQIRDESRLRAALEEIADEQDVAGGSAHLTVQRRIADAVHARPDLQWASSPAPGAGSAHTVRRVVALVAVAVLALITLPVLVLGLGLWLVAVRLRELREQPETGPPDPAHVQDVMQYEDFVAQNPFTAIGLVKPGFVRTTTMRVALAGLQFANRYLFFRDHLAGVRTIHFARWLPLDDGRRLVFASSYDGSLESYMDDFIDRLHWGINLVFSNGVGFPRTRWLIHGGARDEIAYKRYLRRHQVPTVVFYSAYESLTARTVDTNTLVRAGVSRPARDESGAAQWLGLL